MKGSFSSSRLSLGRKLGVGGVANFLRAVYDVTIYRWIAYRASRRRAHFTLALGNAVGKEELVTLFSKLIPHETNISLTRVGGDSDGGYLIPADAFQVEALLSPGVANNSDFEFSFAEKGVPCYLMDPSVESPPLSHPLFSFSRGYLGASNENGSTSLEQWIEESNLRTTTKLGLQMDIEGAEWEVLASVKSETFSRFQFMVIEMHNLHLSLNCAYYRTYRDVLALIEKTHFPVITVANNFALPVKLGSVSIHPVIEVTFLNRSMYYLGSPRLAAHPLSSPNNPRLPNQVLDPDLFRSIVS